MKMDNIACLEVGNEGYMEHIFMHNDCLVGLCLWKHNLYFIEFQNLESGQVSNILKLATYIYAGTV